MGNLAMLIPKWVKNEKGYQNQYYQIIKSL